MSCEQPPEKSKREGESLKEDGVRHADLFAGRALRMANTCMEKLFKDDGSYVSARYALVSTDDAKSLFLYGCAC